MSNENETKVEKNRADDMPVLTPLRPERAAGDAFDPRAFARYAVSCYRTVNEGNRGR